MSKMDNDTKRQLITALTSVLPLREACRAGEVDTKADNTIAYVKVLLERYKEYREANKVSWNAMMDKRSEPEPETSSETKTSLLLLPQADYDDMVERVRRERKVRHRFSGDDFTTTFRRVLGVLLAYDPNFPKGRRVEPTSNLFADGTTSTSAKGWMMERILHWCPEAREGDFFMTFAYDIWVEIAKIKHPMTEHVAYMLAGIFFALTAKNGIDVRLLRPGSSMLAIGVKKSTETENPQALIDTFVLWRLLGC